MLGVVEVDIGEDLVDLIDFDFTYDYDLICG